MVREMRNGPHCAPESLCAVERVWLDCLPEVIILAVQFSHEARPCLLIYRCDLPTLLPIPCFSVALNPRGGRVHAPRDVVDMRRDGRPGDRARGVCGCERHQCAKESPFLAGVGEVAPARWGSLKRFT